MKQYTQIEKERIFQKYNIKLKACEKCGKKPALLRSFTKETLCNDCAHIAFLKFIAVLASIATIIGLVIY